MGKEIKITAITPTRRASSLNLPIKTYKDLIDIGVVPGETKMSIESTATGFRCDKIEESDILKAKNQIAQDKKKKSSKVEK